MFTKIKQALAIWVIKKVQKYGPRKIRVMGKTYEISRDVFNPKFYNTSKFMAENIMLTPEDVVLDMGTGSGIQAITAGQTASMVIAIDVNPEAVRYARRNVIANGLDKIVSVIEGDLFSPLGPDHKFSVILFTPPYLDGTPKTDFEHSLFDPDKKLIERFFTEAREHIKPDGYVQMLYSSLADHKKALQISRQLGWNHKLIANEETFTENFLIYKLNLD